MTNMLASTCPYNTPKTLLPPFIQKPQHRFLQHEAVRYNLVSTSITLKITPLCSLPAHTLPATLYFLCVCSLLCKLVSITQ